jgi:hypothetical protein
MIFMVKCVRQTLDGEVKEYYPQPGITDLGEDLAKIVAHGLKNGAKRDVLDAWVETHTGFGDVLAWRLVVTELDEEDGKTYRYKTEYRTPSSARRAFEKYKRLVERGRFTAATLTEHGNTDANGNRLVMFVDRVTA